MTGIALERLRQRWPLAGERGLRDELLAAYGDPRRGYHDLRHLTEVLDRLDDLAGDGEWYDPLPVLLAAWFHDAVYDGRPGAEDRSARWALDTLPGAGVAHDAVDELARLVRLTEHHDPAADDPAGAALNDADLAVLASPPERYRSYVAGVRHDYAHVSELAFRDGRRAVLEGLLERRRLFATSAGRHRWESAARRNLSAELAWLVRGPAGPVGSAGPPPPGPAG